jgi:hypothetical protein
MLLPAPFSRYGGSIRSLQQKWRSYAETRRNSHDEDPLARRMLDVFLRTWDLGFIAFGGPPVHFQIFHARFVEGKGGKQKWVDEQTVLKPMLINFFRAFSNNSHSIKSSLLFARAFLGQLVRRCSFVLFCFMRE